MARTTSGPAAPVEPTGDPRAPRSVHVPPEQTTLPRYARPASLEPAPHLVVSVGARAAGIASALLRGREPGRDRQRTAVDAAEVAAVVDTELRTVVTGWRVLLVGPEHDVAAGRAAALARGALDAEVTVVAVDVEPGEIEDARSRRVFCGYCHRRFTAHAAVGDPVRCPGCGSVLAVAAHHSRRHGAFLGAPMGAS